MHKRVISHAPKSSLTLAALAALLLAGSANFAGAVDRIPIPEEIEAARTWANTGTDFNAGASWGGTAPGANDVGLFAAAAIMQPNLTANLTIAGLRFSAGATGYIITSTGGAVLTLNGVNTTGSGGTTTASASAIRNDNMTGTTQIDAPLNLAPSTLISTIFQDAGDGSTLILNGNIGETGSVALSLKNGTIQLNGSNTYSGGTSIDAAGTTVVVGNDNGLGTGTFTVNNASTLQAGGGPRTIGNAATLDGTLTIAGSNALTINGAVTVGPSALSRTLTVNNSATTTLAGSVFLSSTAGTGRTLAINGSGAVVISGVVADFNGAGAAGILRYSGSSSLTLNNSNTYSGGTELTGAANGMIIANTDGALGAGNVSLLSTSVQLTLQNGTTNNYISDNATLSLATGSIANLNFVGADTIGSLVLNGVAQAPGVHNMTTDPLFLLGTGNLLVLVPEPSTWAMTIMGAGLLMTVQRFRRKKLS